jgi:hypothetical protein
MQKRREAGAGILMALVLLAGLAAGGAWNYNRNLQLEAAVYRPFRTHTDEDLALLTGALEQQKEQVSTHYEKVAAVRVNARERSHFDQKLREFERVQQAGEAKKTVRAELAKSTTTLKLLADEDRMRAGERDAVKLFFKRLLTI